jgi:indolepyruvate ferredoxin oxidoreductase alpha subunit
MPSLSRRQRPRIIEREKKLEAWFSASALTQVEQRSAKVGVITVGMAYVYVKEVLPEASVLKLASSYPLARDAIRAFCAGVEQVFVVEELEALVETEVRAMGIDAHGKDYFTRIGELSAENVRDGFVRAGVLAARPAAPPAPFAPLVRPPVLCAGCPHIGSYHGLRGDDARVTGDIGCYTLAALKPLAAMDTCVSMGSSKPIVATIGDSTFLHGGIPALIDAVYNQANITVLLLDNRTVAMTGGQDHPGTGKTLRGDATHKVDYEAICRAAGVTWIKRIDSYDLALGHQTLREAMEYDGVAVVISDRPCVLDPVKIKGTPFRVRADACTACQSCMNLGWPAHERDAGTDIRRHARRRAADQCAGGRGRRTGRDHGVQGHGAHRAVA